MFNRLQFYDFEFKNINIEKVIFSDSLDIDYTKTGRYQNLLHLIISGEREYEIDNQIFTIKKDSVIFIPEGTNYITRIKSTSGPCIGIGITFDLCGQIDNCLFKRNIYYKTDNINASVPEKFEELTRLQKMIPVPILKIKALIYNLVFNLLSFDASNISNLITPALLFINEHFTENIPVKLYADMCHLSESYFRKKFSEHTGMSPIAYRNQLRFQEAKKLYLQNYTISEIAEKTGFYDESYFLKQYKQHTGISFKKDSKTIYHSF